MKRGLRRELSSARARLIVRGLGSKRWDMVKRRGELELGNLIEM